MIKEVCLHSYPCITRDRGGCNMYIPLLLGRALANTFTVTHTFIKKKYIKKETLKKEVKSGDMCVILF